MTARAKTDDGLPPQELRIAFPGAALGPFAALIPAMELAARMGPAAVMLGWSWALGPWRWRISLQRDLEGGQ